MESSRRVQRVEKEIRQVVAGFLLTGFNEPAFGYISVSRVVVSKDLRNAKIYVSRLLKEGGEQELDLELLQSKAPVIQTEIHRQLRMKFCPKLRFYHDDGIDHQIKIEGILADIKKNQNT